jgi:archaellum component FlaF (FlaF/FlaG flagellin family)
LGYGTIIAGIYFVAILLVSCYVYADSVNRMSTTSWKSLQEGSSISIGRMRSGLSITNVSVVKNRTELYVNLTNDGAVKIDWDEFREMDVILTYINETDNKATYWCYYSNDSSRHRWSTPVLFPNTSFTNPYPSIVNPLDWDPSEVLLIVINLPTNYQMKNCTVAYLRVILPEGSSNGRSFPTGA